jgi:cystathionine gamma-synthase
MWQAGDLGKPIPDSPHAVSVALPLWEHVIGYEEKDAAVMEALSCGYPRFVLHPYVAQLVRTCEQRFAEKDEACLPFPSEHVARRCVAFIEQHAGAPADVDEFGFNGIYVVSFSRSAFETAKCFWQHAGEIVSSRCALATLQGRSVEEDGAAAKRAIRERIAGWTGAAVEDVFLFPSGMAALAKIHRVVQELSPGAKSAQVGFPYVDLLKLQDKIGPGVHYFALPEERSLREFLDTTAEDDVSGVFCEAPGNPLLTCPDIPWLSEQLRAKGIPLIIDETLGTYVNVDVLPYADVVMTSLTKYVAGAGDIVAGALILNRDSDHYDRIHRCLDVEHEDLLWSEDAVVLEARSRDFPERMARINRTAETLAEHLLSHAVVERLYYPKYVAEAAYRGVRRPGGGYGGLFSILLQDACHTAPAFYNNLRVSKGPNLGTSYTLACPYTLLAHYAELPWAQSCGLSPYLVRVSVGLEDYDDLAARFDAALAVCSAPA